MIWAKTDAGRIEIQKRELVKARARRNLLLLIDGTKSEEMLLAGLAGIGAEDFRALEALALIAPLAGSVRAAEISAAPTAAAQQSAAAPLAERSAPLDYGQFTAALTQLISSELGLRGFVLTLAVERAGTIEELRAVAQRTIDQIRERKGEDAAATARRALYGG